MVFFFKWSISGLFCISQKSTKWPMNVPLVRISGVGSDCSKNCVTTSAYCYFKCGPIPASFCCFRPFHITIQIEIEKTKLDVVLGIQTLATGW